jgi:hypothetical protein
MDLRDRLQSQVDTCDVIYVYDFKHVRCNLVDRVQFVRKECRLLHLFLADFGLKHDISQPVALFKSYNREIFELAVVKFAE